MRVVIIRSCGVLACGFSYAVVILPSAFLKNGQKERERKK